MDDNDFIRKIDNLGRIVIPKELREKVKIQDNENIVIFSKDDKIIIKKYSYISNNYILLSKIANVFYEIYKIPISIIDNNKSIISVGNVGGTKNCFPIIYDSTTIGKLVIYGDDNYINSLGNFIARIIGVMYYTN